MKWTAKHDFIMRLSENLIGKPCFPIEVTGTKIFLLLAS